MDDMSAKTRGGGGHLLYVAPSMLIAKIVLAAEDAFKAINGAFVKHTHTHT